MISKIKQFDVVYVDFGKNMVGSEQGGKRPAIIIQNDVGNHYSNTTIVIPLSTKIKNMYQPTHMLIKKESDKGLDCDSIALGECVRQISKERIEKVMGKISKIHEKQLLIKIYLANIGNNFLGEKMNHY